MAPKPKPPPKKQKGPKRASAEQIRSREKGALLGLAVGDAFGVAGQDRKFPAAMFPELNAFPLSELQGGGTRRLKPGQVTHVTNAASCVAESLKSNQNYDMRATAKIYARWCELAPDVPAPLKATIAAMKSGRPVETLGRQLWLESGQTLKDNTALSRAVPIGVFMAGHREARITAAFRDCGVTHFAPICQLSSAIVSGVVAAAIMCVDEHLTAEGIAKTAHDELTLSASLLAQMQPNWAHLIQLAAQWLQEDLQAAQANDPLLYGPDFFLLRPPIEARVTLRLALWEAMHVPTFEAAVLDTANRGGDAQINTAITGAIAGAIHGERSIRSDWADLVLEAPAPADHESFHPRHLVTLNGAEKLAPPGESFFEG